MSSDSSSVPGKTNVTSRPKPLSKIKTLKSSEDSDERQISQGSRSSLKSDKNTAPPKVTVLEQLSFKPAVIMETFQGEHLQGTATTHVSTTPTVITAVLRDLRDDIVRIPDYRQPGPVALVNGERTVAVIGGENVYVQNKSKFIAVPRDKALSTSHFWPYSAMKDENCSPVDIAVLVQKVFAPLSSVCFGLLGGVALLQLILVSHMMGEGSEQERSFFLQSYSLFAQIAPLLFYILLAVCIVSVFDRITTVHQDAIVCQPSWIVLGVYCLTLVATLSCASYDDMFTLYHHNKTLLQDPKKTQELVNEWQLLNSARCLLALLGWALFSLTSPEDLLLKHLLSVRQYQHDKDHSVNVVENSFH